MAQVRIVTHPFAPIVDANSKVLILGSVPSVKSVEQGFYYMNPRNRFWKVLSEIVGVDLTSLDNEGKSKALLDAGIALYDSVYQCEIEGSKDSSVKVVIATDISQLTADSQINKVLCNGRLSYETAKKYNPHWEDRLVLMPSTSPANAAKDLQTLTKLWKRAIIDAIDKAGGGEA
ncbi:MAG: DNA-deoxyinosine glycosylase [Christensenellales bacterium]